MFTAAEVSSLREQIKHLSTPVSWNQILNEFRETQIWYYITFYGSLNLGLMFILSTVMYEDARFGRLVNPIQIRGGCWLNLAGWDAEAPLCLQWLNFSLQSMLFHIAKCYSRFFWGTILQNVCSGFCVTRIEKSLTIDVTIVQIKFFLTWKSNTIVD